MKLHAISGSLRAASSNTRLLHAAQKLAPKGATIELEHAISELPAFNPDVDISSNDALEDFVQRVRESDGIVVSSPVYAGGYPGALKNALDWLVGTDAFVEMPFMMLSASNRMPDVERTLVAVLETMNGVHIADASVAIPLLGTSLTVTNIVSDDGVATTLRRKLGQFVDAIELRDA